MLKTIPIWHLMPFCPPFDMRDYHRWGGSVTPTVRELDDGRYSLIDCHWNVLAARTSGIHYIEVDIRSSTREEALAARTFQ